MGTKRASTMARGPCLLEEGLGLLDVGLLEEAGVGPLEERRPDPLTERVAHLVAGDRGDPDARGCSGTSGRWRLSSTLDGAEARNPAVKSSASPGRKKPMSSPDSANTMAKMPSSPNVSMR